MKRHFLMLAHKLEKKYSVAGQYISEKLDGMRCFWDGGVSKGLFCLEVPYSNTEKDSRLKVTPVATGLWSRYGKVIHAPDWFLDQLPLFPCDGELFAGRGNFQKLISISKQQEPNEEDWKNISYLVFDSPHPSRVFSDGTINETNFKKTFSGCFEWFLSKYAGPIWSVSCTFQDIYSILKKEIKENPYLGVHKQVQLPFNTTEAWEQIESYLETIVKNGGEGLMLRRGASYWQPERSHDLLKYKPFQDAEGMVVGYKWGEETDKGSKLLGLMGSMRVRFNGKEFWLSGFAENERELEYCVGQTLGLLTNQNRTPKDYGRLHPGETIDERFENPKFPIGSIVTFKYRELTIEGIPKEARFWRKHE